MAASTTSNCAKTMPVSSLNIFAFWQMLVIKDWQNFIETARRLSRNPNIMRRQNEKNRAIGVWHENES